jgi:hypothetical protein
MRDLGDLHTQDLKGCLCELDKQLQVGPSYRVVTSAKL